MISALISRLVTLVFGTLYPAYQSYKAISSRDVKQYARWMVYWIVFALFLTLEACTDIFLSWFPFYYEIKTVFVLWLLSPFSKGATLVYRRVVKPWLQSNEHAIDGHLARAQSSGSDLLVTFGSRACFGLSKVAVDLYKAVIAQQENNRMLRSSSTTVSRTVSMPDGFEEEVDRVDHFKDEAVISEVMETDEEQLVETRIATSGVRTRRGTRHTTDLTSNTDVSDVRRASDVDYLTSRPVDLSTWRSKYDMPPSSSFQPPDYLVETASTSRMRVSSQVRGSKRSKPASERATVDTRQAKIASEGWDLSTSLASATTGLKNLLSPRSNDHESD